MKIVKIIVMLGVVSLFTSTPLAVNAKDCSQYSVLSHKWNACKLGSKKYTGTEGSGTKKEKKSNGFWKKIKNFGGENVGGEG
jgi:hypothetical protein